LLRQDYRTYGQLMAEKRFVINSVPTIFNDIFVRDPDLGYTLKRNTKIVRQDREHGTRDTTTSNRNGFRTREFDERDPAKRAIMVLGDSVTCGDGVDDEEISGATRTGAGWQRAGFQSRRWRMGFCGILSGLQEVLPHAQTGPDYVGAFPSNDFTNLEDSTWEGKRAWAMPDSTFQRRDVQIDREGRFSSRRCTYRIPGLRQSALFILLSDSYYRGLRRLRRNWEPAAVPFSIQILKEMARQADCPILVAVLPAQYNYPTGFYPKGFIEALRGAKELYALDLYPVVAPHADKLYVDGSHFNTVGNKLVAQEIKRFVADHPVLARELRAGFPPR
jgi:lysophospholipase L1-like esterase